MRGNARPRHLTRLAFLCGAILFASCQHLKTNSCAVLCEREIPQFDLAFDDAPISVRSFCIEEFPLAVHAARIDLERVEILLSSEVDTAENFAKKSGAALAFNVTPFDRRKKPVGVLFAEGIFLSPANARYDAVAFEKSGATVVPAIADGQVFDGGKTFLACGGFWRILDGGCALQFKTFRDSRIALGYDLSKRFLFVLQAEGEFKARSGGASFAETAEILRRLGAVDAIMLDGGSSASLVVDGKQINSVWLKRRVPVCLGFK